MTIATISPIWKLIKSVSLSIIARMWIQHSDCYTGERDCSSTQICSQPGYCQGNTLSQNAAENKLECQEQCYDNQQCLWYTFQETANLCVLTSTCSPQNATNSVYGQRSCFNDNTKPSIFKKLCKNFPHLTLNIKQGFGLN